MNVKSNVFDFFSRPKMVLDDLPSELLLKIFGFLSLNELGTVARVCVHSFFCKMLKFYSVYHLQFLFKVF